MLLISLKQFQIIKLLPLILLNLDLSVTNLLIINLLTLVFFIKLTNNIPVKIINHMLGIRLFLKNQLLGQQRIMIFIIFLYCIDCWSVCLEQPMLQGIDEYVDLMEEQINELPRRKVPLVWGVKEYVFCSIFMTSLYAVIFALA